MYIYSFSEVLRLSEFLAELSYIPVKFPKALSILISVSAL